MLLYFLLILLIPLLASGLVQSTYRKYKNYAASSGLTGYEVARKILDANGLYDVNIEEVHGVLSDHYDPHTKTVRLSSDNFHGRSLSAVAVAAHEVGHALQDQQDYAFLRLRSSLVPVASFGSQAAYILILIGLIFQMTNLALLGIIFMAFAVAFHIVTLPVEFNASSRAMTQVVQLGIIGPQEAGGAKKVLGAAAFTYVAAALVALLELLRFIMIFAGQDD